MIERPSPWRLSLAIGVLGLLLASGSGLFSGQQPPRLADTARLVAADIPGRVDLVDADLAPADNLQAALLPLGPDRLALPGDGALWQALLNPAAVLDRPAQREGFDGFQAWDAPTVPLQAPLVTLPLASVVANVSLQGDLVFVLLQNGAWLLIDLGSWQQPAVHNLTPAGVHVLSMAVRGQRAWLLSSHGELLVMDISTPQRPRELARLTVPLPGGDGGLALQDDLLLLNVPAGSSDQPQLYVYSLGRGELPVLLGAAALRSFRPGSLWANRQVFIPLIEGGVAIYDLAEPLQPRLTASIAMAEMVEKMTLRGRTLQLLGMHRGIYEVDLDAPELKPRKLVYNSAAAALMLIQAPYIAAFTRTHGLQLFSRAGLPARLLAVRQHQDYLEGAPLPAGQGEVPRLLVEQGAASADLPAPGQAPLELLSLPGDQSVLAAARTAHDLLVLRADGRLQQFADGEPFELPLDKELRWLTAYRQWVYLGGGDQLVVLRRDAQNRLQVAGRVALDARRTWAGTLSAGALLVAAGRDGLQAFSLATPDRPQQLPDWSLPRALADRLDVRGVAVSGQALFVAAGRAGLLQGEWAEPDRLVVTDMMNFPEPVRAVAMQGRFCLAATERTVHVVSTTGPQPLQWLGTIDLAGVERLISFNDQWWGGLVPGRGWRCLPAPLPAALDPERTTDRLRLQFPPPARAWNYQAVLFNPAGGVTVSGDLELVAADGSSPGAVSQ